MAIAASKAHEPHCRLSLVCQSLLAQHAFHPLTSSNQASTDPSPRHPLDRYFAHPYAGNSHPARHLSPAQLPGAPPTTSRPEGRPDSTPSPHLSPYSVDHPAVSEGLRASTEIRTSSATPRMHPSTGGVGPSSASSRCHQPTRADDVTWRVNVRRQDESPVDSDLTTFTGQMSMRSGVDSASSKSTTAGPDGRLAKYVCSYCGKRFNRPSSLKVSLYRHPGASSPPTARC
jgi:hypothetical protein